MIEEEAGFGELELDESWIAVRIGDEVDAGVEDLLLDAEDV